jgi:molybdopterin synthase catalytic subunit
MKIEIRDKPFDPCRELANHQANLHALRGHYGATASFIGTMRDHNEGDQVYGMTLEHYPGMTERQLQCILEEAQLNWKLLETLIIHRVGELHPNDPIVLIAVWCAHRAEAFEACRFIVEALKSKAPFWKKELLADRYRWVMQNTSG